MRRFLLLCLALWAPHFAAADMYVRDSGAWREIQEFHVRYSGAWREVQEGWVRDAGVWRQFYAAVAISLADLDSNDVTRTALTTSGNPVTTIAGVRVGAAGTLHRSEGVGTGSSYTADADFDEWADAAVSGGDYEARLTVNSGTSPEGASSATGSWLALSTQRTWEIGVTGETDSDTGNWTLEIRRVSDSVVVASATFNITATVALA